MAEMTVDEYLKAQEAEWGTYVAVVPIDINGARAFNVGHAVPVSHVEGGLVDKSSVARRSTKAAEKALDPDNQE